ncbi:AsmA family protein [Pedobacter sp.]|uniref:AsmA family protein n=1 Tax=Pedobacter sp. TaxID=1411316 RepID=UPI003D7FB50B
MPHWSKILLKVFAIVIGLVLFMYVVAALYVHANKKEILVSVTKELNKNLEGDLSIGGMEPTFLGGFPGLSMTLNNVEIKDKQWKQHKHTLLSAKKFDIAVNPLALIKGTIEIKRITIDQASIYLYTDTNGYTNTSALKKKNKDTSKKEESSTSAELKRLTLNNGIFIVDNQKGHKLFHFEVNQLVGKIDYPSSGWQADLKLKTMVKSLAFNTRKGSFMKDKLLEGPFLVHYDNQTEVVTVDPKKVKIGEEDFILGGKFKMAKNPVEFSINIKAPEILWVNAYALLTPNISKKLKLFNLEKPISVNCNITGNMGGGGDPLINVGALVRQNVLVTPGGKVKNCNFDGSYTNENFKGRGFNDANSAVRLYHFTGLYEGIPVNIDTAAINNLERPVATGMFQSNFDISRLNEVIGEDLLKFNGGRAGVKLAYSADIVDFKLTKPYVKGTVVIKDADINYVPRGLNFKNSSVSLVFTEKDLLIKNLRLQSGKSIVNMEGSIKNFLNLYYTAPEKILLNWQIRSPQLYLGEFFGFLSQRKPVKKIKKKSSSTLSEDLNAVFESSRVALDMVVDKLYYQKFLATDARAELYLSQNGITVSNVRVKHAGGLLKMNGSLSQQGRANHFDMNATISNVDIKHFFYAFNNFGLTTLTSDNLKGYLFSKVKLAGSLTEQGKILKNSLRGHVIFDFKEGELLNFEPITSVGQFAFPLRDLKNINFRNLNGKFDLNGEKIIINPMNISSNVLNMDVAGVYSLGLGTNIALDIPLRNPKKDVEIEDAEEKLKKRMKGIVLHILATDGENGKIKFKWNKNHD